MVAGDGCHSHCRLPPRVSTGTRSSVGTRKRSRVDRRPARTSRTAVRKSPATPGFFWVVLPASLLTSSGDTDTPVKQQARRAHHVSVRCSSSKYGCLLAKLHDDDSGLLP